ncbi:MAG: hypothetical protein ABIK79_05255 [Chloroflexota bacterium]
MLLLHQVEQAREDAAALEKLYRQAASIGDEISFREAISQSVRNHPGNLLFQAWACRLDLDPSLAITESEDRAREKQGSRHWWIALMGSAILGAIYVFLVGHKIPIPVPGEATDLFWLGYAPVTAVAILIYLALDGRATKRWQWYAAAALAVALLGTVTAWMAWGRRDDVAGLTAIHLPFIAWTAVGVGVSLGYRDIAGHNVAGYNVARQFYGFLVKSAETILTAGIYMLAGMILIGLSVGIFAALGVTIPEELMRIVSSAGLGLLPILALASLYDSSRAPTDQSWASGLARLLKILTRLILAPALLVLAIYIFWFVPMHFWQPFRERDVLIIYNATIMAIIATLACTVPDPSEQLSAKASLMLRYAILTTSSLTFLLNIYALAAVASRTISGGLTPNRHAVLGWNVVTLLILGFVTLKLWQDKSETWPDAFRGSIARSMLPAIAWALWVLFGLPRF